MAAARPDPPQDYRPTLRSRGPDPGVPGLVVGCCLDELDWLISVLCSYFIFPDFINSQTLHVNIIPEYVSGPDLTPGSSP